MAKKFDNISNNNVRLGGNGLKGLFSSTTAKFGEETDKVTPSVISSSVTTETVKNAQPVTTRQTFVVFADDLQFIKDLVRARRMEGETEFTQKEALHDIINFYRNSQASK